jgi:Protein of unknown function (DUF5672)
LSNASERPVLGDVTLVAVTSVAMSATIDAIRASIGQAEFGQILLLSNERPADLDDVITWRPIKRLASRADYSRFMLRDLAGHIQTSHALCIQWDGYVLNGRAWQSAFLDYDYIGAPWPHFCDHLNVGNGGFSLRSRRLLAACTALPLDGKDPEDIVISRLCRRQLEAQGIRFAPESLARQFSYERMVPTGEEFGFHGAFNLVRHLSTRDAERIFRSLEPRILARSERWELLRWALSRGRLSLASNMLGRII